MRDAARAGPGASQYCQPGATFSAQADALAGVTTLEGYTDWMKGLFTPAPDGRYELKSFAVDDAREATSSPTACSAARTPGEGGPVPPTGKAVAADYVYVMDFDGDKIRHMTKIWNDVHSLRQIGWM